MEEWRDVVGYEGVYSISSCGRLRRDRTRGGRPTCHFLSTPLDKDGYMKAVLHHASRRVDTAVHRLVARSFIGQPPFADAEVNHKNGIKTDNAPANLEYVTSAENLRHTISLTGARRGSRNGRAKLTKADVETIRARFAAGGVTQQALADEFGVIQGTISAIVHKRLWPDHYGFS